LSGNAIMTEVFQVDHGACAMKYQASRRTVLATAGAAAAAAAVGPATAQSTDVRGTVTFEGGAVIPKGHLEIYLDDPALRGDARRRAARTRIESDGGSEAIAFSLSLPAGSTALPTLQIVARMERADGWLIARGSAQLKAGSPVHITLNAVMY